MFGKNIIAVALSITIAFLGAFSYIAGVAPLFPGDKEVSVLVQSWRAPWLDSVMVWVSVLGIEIIAIVVVLVTALSFFLKGRGRHAIFIVASISIGYLIRTLLKYLVARPRPSDVLVQVIGDADGYSFPSGHVMHYVIFFSLLIFVSWADIRSGVVRAVTQSIAVVCIGLIGFSRVYLGVHWMSDVVGGWVFGAVVVSISIWVWLKWFNGERCSASHYFK